MNRNTEVAFKWIIAILRDNKIPFQITGGLAARVYGATRPLHDIDIELPDRYFSQLQPYVKKYIIYGPERYRDQTFDLLLMTLKYEGQEIDLSGSETDKLYNEETKRWESCATNIDNANKQEVYGLIVPVIKKEDLIIYKQKIKRPTDLKDVELF